MNGSARVNIASVDEHKYFTFTLDESDCIVFILRINQEVPGYLLARFIMVPVFKWYSFAYTLAAGVTYCWMQLAYQEQDLIQYIWRS